MYSNTHKYTVFRMEAALAELGLEDLNKEAEDDNEFFVVKGSLPMNLYIRELMSDAPSSR